MDHRSWYALAGLCLASAAHAQPAPRAAIPPQLAHALAHGDTRVVVVGDSISVNQGGDPGQVGHSPIVVGIARQWQPDAWHGLYASTTGNTPGGYQTVRGVGASTYDSPDATESNTPMTPTTPWPGGLAGFGTEVGVRVQFNGSGQEWWRPRASFRLYNSEWQGASPVSRSLIQRPNLHARNIVYTHPAMVGMTDVVVSVYDETGAVIHLGEITSLPLDNARAGWAGVDFPVGAFLPPTFDRGSDDLRIDLLPRPSADQGTYITSGVLFFDPATPGLQVHSIAQGGWNALDHTVTTGDFRGYSDLGIQENLRVMGFADPGVTPVVMLAIGSNVGPGEADGVGATELFSSRVRQIIARYEAALDAIGAGDHYILLVGMYSLDLPPDIYGLDRARRLYEISQEAPRRGFINLNRILGTKGIDFDASWYHRQAETIVTQAAAPGATTLNVGSTANFIRSNDYFYVTDGTTGQLGSFMSYSGTQLIGVQFFQPIPAGARLTPGAGDVHLSRAGSDRVAEAMWEEITAALPAGCDADYDLDGDSATDADIEAFFACLAGDCCLGCSQDFNRDGDNSTDADIESFFRVLAGQPC
jgi:hypothetical protein